MLTDILKIFIQDEWNHTRKRKRAKNNGLQKTIFVSCIRQCLSCRLPNRSGRALYLLGVGPKNMRNSLHHSREAGFSLLELLTVVVTISVIASMSVPAINVVRNGYRLTAARDAGASEALFLRDDGLLTEGCFTNLFVEREGKLLTPPARLGLLPGVLRRSLLDDGHAVEAELTLDDLKDGFLVGNALRGLMKAKLL